jgi:hypothetical protein
MSAAGPPQGAQPPRGERREATLGGEHAIAAGPPGTPVRAGRSEGSEGASATALTGLAVAVAIGVWWLGSARLALDHGTDAGRGAADALDALWLVRGMALSTLCVRAGARYGWRLGAKAGLGLISPSWPVVALAWSASATSLAQVVLAELLLLTASAVLPWLGLFLRRSLRRVELAVVAGTGAGTALAAALWAASGSPYLPLP